MGRSGGGAGGAGGAGGGSSRSTGGGNTIESLRDSLPADVRGGFDQIVKTSTPEKVAKMIKATRFHIEKQQEILRNTPKRRNLTAREKASEIDKATRQLENKTNALKALEAAKKVLAQQT